MFYFNVNAMNSFYLFIFYLLTLTLFQCQCYLMFNFIQFHFFNFVKYYWSTYICFVKYLRIIRAINTILIWKQHKLFRVRKGSRRMFFLKRKIPERKRKCWQNLNYCFNRRLYFIFRLKYMSIYSNFFWIMSQILC